MSRLYYAQHPFKIAWFTETRTPSHFCAECGLSAVNHLTLPYGWPDPERTQTRLI